MKQRLHITVPLHMEARADWPTLHMRRSQNWLGGGDTLPLLRPGRPGAGRVHRRRQLSLERGRTRAHTKGGLGRHEHLPGTGCPSNAFNFPLRLYPGFMLVGQSGEGHVPSCTLWKPCWSERGAGLGLASPHTALKLTGWLTTGSLPGHPAWLSSSGH